MKDRRAASKLKDSRDMGYRERELDVINYTLITKNKHDDYMHRVDSNHYEHID